MNHSAIRNILFDLGGVLYEIDVPNTRAGFTALFASGAEVPENPLLHAAFAELEAGEIEIDEWTARVRKAYGWESSDAELKKIWMGILVGLFPGREILIHQLAERFALGLLSNTSRFHYEHYITECRPIFEKMQHLFFSFELGLNKPDPAIYRAVLEKSGWKAEETLFLDDSPANVAAASELGIQSVLIDQPDRVIEVAEKLMGK